MSARQPANQAFEAGIDGIVPGVTFSWGDLIVYNEGTSPAVVDGAMLNGAPPDLIVVGASAVPLVAGAPQLMDFASIPPAYRETLAARPLLGSQIDPASTPGWGHGVLLVFQLRTPQAGSIRVDSVTLRYHVGVDRYTATYPYSLNGCAGADLAPGSPCPYGSAAATSAPSAAGR